jgi:3-hydroxyisobutyrate dehydrogenase
VAGSPAEAVRGADIVVTMLTDGAAVEKTMATAADAFAPGAIWVQSSTVGLAALGRLAAISTEHGLAFVDAPMVGTRTPAEQGELTALVAGPAAVRPRIEPLLESVASSTVWVGEEAGDATALKLVLNHWLLNLVENLAETLALAGALGVDGRRVVDILAESAVGSPYARLKGEAMLEGSFPPAFPLRLALKDARLVAEAAQAANVELPLLHDVLERFARAIDLGHGDDDMAATWYAASP